MSLSGGAIAGIVVGAIIFILVAAYFVYRWRFKGWSKPQPHVPGMNAMQHEVAMNTARSHRDYQSDFAKHHMFEDARHHNEHRFKKNAAYVYSSDEAAIKAGNEDWHL